MLKIVSIDDVTVVKNLTEEEYKDCRQLVEKILNRLVCEIASKIGMIDIGEGTLVKVLRNSNDLIVSVDDMYANKYYKEQVVEAWF